MVQIPTFAVEEWMDEYEVIAKHNLAETCCASVTIDELLGLSESKSKTVGELLNSSTVQDYGEIRGSTELRNNLSRLYSSKVSTPLPADNILITNGAIAANHLALYSLVGPGDHVICHYPTYQQLYTLPATFGAEVDLWKSNPEKEWLPSIEDLKSLIKPNTKLIIINNPQNPTGAILPRTFLNSLVSLADSHSVPILSDEVYRPLFHSISPADPEFPPSLLSLGYSRTIATGSLSKAYSLAGVRVGWIATRDRELVEKFASARHYTTISVSKLDQSVAAFALSGDVIHGLLARNLGLARENLELLGKWIDRHDDCCTWVKPKAGTTAFVKFEREGRAVDAVALCKAIMEKTGVMWLPGSYGFGEEFKGYVRIGYVNRTEVIKQGLQEAREFMKKDFEKVPLCE